MRHWCPEEQGLPDTERIELFGEVVIMTWNDIKNCFPWKMQADDFSKVVCKICARDCVWKERMATEGAILWNWLLYLLSTSKHVSAQTALQVTVQASHTDVQGTPTILSTYLATLSLVPFTSHLLQSHRLLTVLTTCWFSKIQINKHLFHVHHMLGISLEAKEERRRRSHCFCP